MKRTGLFLKTNAQSYALIGACFGLLFPILAILIRTVGAGLPLSVSSILAAHAADPLLWIIATAPLFLRIASGADSSGKRPIWSEATMFLMLGAAC